MFEMFATAAQIKLMNKLALKLGYDGHEDAILDIVIGGDIDPDGLHVNAFEAIDALEDVVQDMLDNAEE